MQHELFNKQNWFKLANSEQSTVGCETDCGTAFGKTGKSPNERGKTSSVSELITIMPMHGAERERAGGQLRNHLFRQPRLHLNA